MVVFHRVHLGLGSKCKGQPQTAYTEINRCFSKGVKEWIQILFPLEGGAVLNFFLRHKPISPGGSKFCT